ncbi:hypothetical protein M1271_05965 [Patescibacteria group bacterium]|nr:hypothetical protein [Patescibacteria group bacterium]
MPTLSKQTRYLIIISCLVSVLTISALFLYFKSAPNKTPGTKQAKIVPVSIQPEKISLGNALSTRGKFPQYEKIAKVGNEIIYGRDLNYISFTRYPPDFLNMETSLEKIKQDALPVAIENSILLQTDNKENNLNLPATIFNNPDKNYNQREKIADDIKIRKLAEEEKISGSFISI